MVLVHGYADSGYSWHRNVPALLKEGFRLLIPDQPGLGRSGLPPDPYTYSVENQAESILSLTDRLGLERVRLVGHSQGGGIVLYLCLNHPERIERAVVIDSACFEPSRPGKIFVNLPWVDRLASAFSSKWAVKRVLKSVFMDDSRLSEAMFDEYARFLSKSGYFRALMGLSRDYFSEEHKRMAASYEEIGLPVLIVWGEKDPWLPESFGKRLHEQVPDSGTRSFRARATTRTRSARTLSTHKSWTFYSRTWPAAD